MRRGHRRLAQTPSAGIRLGETTTAVAHTAMSGTGTIAEGVEESRMLAHTTTARRCVPLLFSFVESSALIFGPRSQSSSRRRSRSPSPRRREKEVRFVRSAFRSAPS